MLYNTEFEKQVFRKPTPFILPAMKTEHKIILFGLSKYA